MDKLCGLGSLQVVSHKFSDGVQVVRCVLDFFKSMADVELAYSQSISRLVRSSAYTFHSNILMQWLGSEPYEETRTMKHCWQQLGTELSLLADHHANKAEGYLTPVRIQLQTLLPRLEDMRMKLKNKTQQLRTLVEIAEKIHSKEKTKYQQMGDTCLRLRGRMDGEEGQQPGVIRMKMTEHREAVMTRDLELQEKAYKTAHEELVKIYQSFNKDIEELYTEVEQTERERVKTLKESLQQFTKNLSNTAPVYLEGMSKIVLSIDEIDASSDIDSFVESQAQLLEKLTPPAFEQHQAATLTPHPQIREEIPPDTRTQTENDSESMLNGNRTQTENDSMLNGNRTPSLSPDPDTERVKDQSAQIKNEHKNSSEEVVLRVAKKRPSVKPKPPLITDHREQSNDNHATSSSSRSSDHTSSSSSHVSQVISRMESSGEAASRPHKPAKIVLPSVSSLEQTARPRTRTDPSPLTKPISSRRLSAHVPKHNEVAGMLEQLRRLAVSNDCYGLLGVDSSASLEELTRARREKSRQLHPDHFAGQPDRKHKAEEQLSRINQIFQDVLKTPDKRDLYDKLCHFRKFYERIPEQYKGLNKARGKLEDQSRLMKKAQFPLTLLEEAQLAVQLIELRMAKVPHDST